MDPLFCFARVFKTNKVAPRATWKQTIAHLNFHFKLKSLVYSQLMGLIQNNSLPTEKQATRFDCKTERTRARPDYQEPKIVLRSTKRTRSIAQWRISLDQRPKACGTRNQKALGLVRIPRRRPLYRWLGAIFKPSIEVGLPFFDKRYPSLSSIRQVVCNGCFGRNFI